MIKRLFFFLLLFNFIALAKPVYSKMSERYVVFVNPVRDRIFWKSLDYVEDQLNIFTKKHLSSTWLITYSLLEDESVVSLLKSMPKNQEIGIFFEIDQTLADDAFSPYLIGEGDWARPDKVFLQGYYPSERKRMIDVFFQKFKKTFGYFPASVGAWYIDSLSLNYMYQKYQLKAYMDCADQFITDKYGLWGHPWSGAYYSSKINNLMPANNQDRLKIVRLQWAQRDAIKGYGGNISDSTYSVQANDYVAHHSLGIDYFKKLVNDYLYSQNPLNQLTIGIEAGQEGRQFRKEYKLQVEYLKTLSQKGEIEVKTMSDFAKIFFDNYQKLSPNSFVSGTDETRDVKAYWFSTPFYRIGIVRERDKLRIRDFRPYDNNFVFSDIVDKDSRVFLKRYLPYFIDEQNDKKSSKLLVSTVSSVQVKNIADEVSFKIQDKKKQTHTIELKTDKIIINDKVFFSADKEKTGKTIVQYKVIELIMDYYLNKSHLWQPSLRWSKIQNTYYLGLWLGPDKYIAIRSSWPFFGRFDFSFQTLVRFMTFPRFDPVLELSKYFINRLNNSTIKEVEINNLQLESL